MNEKLDLILKFLVFLIVLWIGVGLFSYFNYKEDFIDKKTKNVKWGKLALYSFGFTILIILMILFGGSGVMII
jgi:hypothetical protein